jgi:hypothetical protein
MVRFARGSKRSKDIRDAARVVSYVLEQGDRQDQVVLTADWILDGLDDKSIVYFVAAGLVIDVHSDIPISITPGQERPIDSANFENVSGAPFETRDDSPPQFIVVRRKSEKSGKPAFQRPTQRPIGRDESPQAGHPLPSDPRFQGRLAFRRLDARHRDATASIEATLGSNSGTRCARHPSSPIDGSQQSCPESCGQFPLSGAE